MIIYQLVGRISKTIKIPSILSGFFWGNLVRKSQVKTQPRLSGRLEEYPGNLNFQNGGGDDSEESEPEPPQPPREGPRDFSGINFLYPRKSKMTSWKENNPAEDVSPIKNMVFFSS